MCCRKEPQLGCRRRCGANRVAADTKPEAAHNQNDTLQEIGPGHVITLADNDAGNRTDQREPHHQHPGAANKALHDGGEIGKRQKTIGHKNDDEIKHQTYRGEYQAVFCKNFFLLNHKNSLSRAPRGDKHDALTNTARRQIL